MTRFPLSHVLGLYEQVAKRLARLLAFLDEAEQSAVAGERELLHQMRSSLDLEPFFDFLADVARFDAEQVTDLGMLREWLTGYFAVSNLVHEIQKEISLLTSLPPLPAEIYTALRSLLPDTYRKLLTPTILYTSSSVPEHFRRSRGMSRSGPGRTVIRLPYIDRNAPVMWALLCHELAHAIDGHVGLTTKVLDRVKSLGVLPKRYTAEEAELLQNWTREFTCDRVALRLAGPSYLYAFVTWQLAWHPFQEPGHYLPAYTHPQPHHRILLMRNWLLADGCNLSDLHEYEKLFFDVTRILRRPQNIFNLFQLPIKFTATACTECGRTIPDKLPRFIALPIRSNHRQDWLAALEPVIQSIDKEVAELPLSQCYLAERVPRIKDLASVLAKGVPVGAWPDNWDPQELSQNLQRAIREQTLTRDRFYELAETIAPDASSFSEVIGAAWYVQATHHRQNFQEIFARAQDPADSWSEFFELVKTFDYTVVKSIETAKIVQVWRQFGNGVGTVERGADSSSNVPHG